MNPDKGLSGLKFMTKKLKKLSEMSKILIHEIYIYKSIFLWNDFPFGLLFSRDEWRMGIEFYTKCTGSKSIGCSVRI